MTALEITLSLALLASLVLCARFWITGRRTSPVSPGAHSRVPTSSFSPAPSDSPPPQPERLPPMRADVSAAQQLDAHSQPLFQAAAVTLDLGMAVVDLARQVRFVNQQALEMLEAVPGAAERSLITLLRDHQADMLVAEVLHDGETRETAMKPIASGRTLRLRCTPLNPGGYTLGALLVVRDITQISMLERSRRDLVANVSHELRTLWPRSSCWSRRCSPIRRRMSRGVCSARWPRRSTR